MVGFKQVLNRGFFFFSGDLGVGEGDPVSLFKYYFLMLLPYAYFALICLFMFALSRLFFFFFLRKAVTSVKKKKREHLLFLHLLKPA